jgi:outer membrane protein assembly factor BamA
MLKKILITFFAFLLTLLQVPAQTVENPSKTVVFKMLSKAHIEKKIDRVLLKYASEGYAFCRISLDSLSERFVFCTLSPGEKTKMKNIYFIGENKISPDYIYNSLGLKPGDFFDEKKIRNSDAVLSANPLFEVFKKSETEFFDDGADLFLYFNTLKNNTLRAFVSLGYDDRSGRYYPCGNAEAALNNNFSRGEEMYFSWTGYGRKSQDLVLNLRFPFFFKSPVSAAFSLNLNKSDSLCLRTSVSPRISCKTGSFFETFFLADFRRIIPSSKENNIEIRDVKTQLFGVESVFKNVFCVFKGGFSAGGREKKPMTEFYGVFSCKKFLGNVFYFSTLFEAKAMLTREIVSEYEKYPLGGAGSLRGFEKNQFYASRYILMNSEFGYKAGKSLSCFAFYDLCFHGAENSALGPGIQFENPRSVLSFVYAVPFYEKKMQPFRYSKFHIFITLKF